MSMGGWNEGSRRSRQRRMAWLAWLGWLARRASKNGAPDLTCLRQPAITAAQGEDGQTAWSARLPHVATCLQHEARLECVVVHHRLNPHILPPPLMIPMPQHCLSHPKREGWRRSQQPCQPVHPASAVCQCRAWLHTYRIPGRFMSICR